MPTRDLEALYRANAYPAQLDGVALVLRPGRCAPALDDALATRGLADAAYVTAHDPDGVRADAASNEARQHALRAALAGRFSWVEAPGGWPEGADDPEGLREPSLLVLGLGRDEAIALGRRFGQAAIVVHARGAPTELVML